MKKELVTISVSRKDFITRAQQCDVALGFETAIGLNTVTTARRGLAAGH
jgi:glutamate carboxypeptidase